MDKFLASQVNQYLHLLQEAQGLRSAELRLSLRRQGIDMTAFDALKEEFLTAPLTYYVFYTNLGYHDDREFKSEAEAVRWGRETGFEFSVRVQAAGMHWSTRATIGTLALFGGYSKI